MKTKGTWLKWAAAAGGAVVLAAGVLLVVFWQTGLKRTIPLTQDEICAYGAYRPALPGETDEGFDPVAFFLRDCSVLKTSTLEDHLCVTYSGGSIAHHLPACRKVDDVSTVDSRLYITYTAIDDRLVVLCYTPEGFAHLLVYDERTDIAAFLSEEDGTAEKYIHFRG